MLAGESLAIAVEHYLDIGRAVPSPWLRTELPLALLGPKMAARVLLPVAKNSNRRGFNASI